MGLKVTFEPLRLFFLLRARDLKSKTLALVISFKRMNSDEQILRLVFKRHRRKRCCFKMRKLLEPTENTLNGTCSGVKKRNLGRFRMRRECVLKGNSSQKNCRNDCVQKT